jgi:phage terminase small subunit
MLVEKQKKLAPMREVFVSEYLVDLNGTAAAIRAGYSEKTANEQAARLLADPMVKAAIQSRLRKRKKNNEELAQALIEELTAIALSNVGDVLEFDDKGVTVKPSSELELETLAILSEVSCIADKKSTKVSVKMHDKISAIRLLMQHLGMFELPKLSNQGEVVIVKIPDNGRDTLNEFENG